MKKINCIKNKNFVKYVKENLIVTLKCIIKFEITFITQENIGASHIISVT